MKNAYSRRFILALVAPLAVLAGSCSGGEGQGVTLSNITGKPGQVLVVSPIAIDEADLGEALRDVLEEEFPFIPQSEPSFSLSFVTERKFESVLHSFRNIIWVVPDADSVECSIRIAQDRWASPQSIVYLHGPDYAAIASHVRARAYDLFQVFTQVERDRLLASHAKVRDVALGDKLEHRFGLRLDVPKGYQVRRDTVDFTWVSYETPDISQGLILYKMRDLGDALSLDTLIAHRDGWTRRFVPGPTADTYMEVSHVIPPDAVLLRFGADTLQRVRGFWEVHGHAMGGSFISYSRRTPGGDSVVTASGYIYAPRFGKRNYVRELEAILLSDVLGH